MNPTANLIQPAKQRALSSRACPPWQAKQGVGGFCALRSLLTFVVLLVATGALRPPPSTAKEPRPHITAIDHVVISTSGLKAGREFYSKLGLSAGGAGCRHVAQDCFTVNWATRTHIELRSSPSCPSSSCLGQIVFRTDNAKKLRDFLTRQGIKVGPVEQLSNASLKFDVADPGGNYISFMQVLVNPIDDPPPDASHGHIVHAGFIVRDRAAMEHFYKDVLGFRPYWHGGMKDDQTDWVSLQVPDGTDWVEFMVNVPENADQRLRGIMNHIALGVPDIQAAREQLVKNGVHLTEEPKLGRDGKWQLNLYDPDQTRIEFMEFAPKEKPCCSEFTGPHPKP
jgi:catechol 2,3-dioxygenase-like lactoylglutathione lyase family enzyme